MQIGAIDHHGAVESARTHQGRIERFGAIGGGHDDDAAVGIEPVHLDEKLVERLLALIVPADRDAAARLAEGVEFVDEDDARGLTFRLAEQIAHPAGADADEHLDEIGPAHAEERHIRLAGDRLAQQRLARARRADQQHALRNAAAERLVFLRRLQKIDDFAQFGHRFVDAGDILEGDLKVLLSVELVLAAAERQRPAAAGHIA